MQKLVSNGAAQMSGILLHAVDQLIRDKRGAKLVRERERERERESVKEREERESEGVRE